MLAGCQVERGIDSQIASDPFQTTITATRELSTRSFLQVSGSEESPSYNILWDAPDSILVAYGGTTPASFVSKNEEPAAEATFVGKLPEGSGNLYGIYPANSASTVSSDGTISIDFKADQDAVAGSYDPEAFPAVAVSESNNLSFQNICSLLAIKVSDDNIAKITLKGNGGACFYGGTLSVIADGDEPVIDDFSEDVYEITLTADGAFDPTQTYYMSVPPIGFEDGVTFTLTRDDGSTADVVISNTVTAERSKVHDVGVLSFTIPVSEFSVNPTEIEMELGDDPVVITATVGPENATDPTVVWQSSAEEIATVADGVVTAVAAGDCLIQAFVNYDTADEISITIPVTVKPMAVVEEVVLSADFEYINVGESDYLTLTLYPENVPVTSITWSTTGGYASVDPDTGEITGVSAGVATITVTVVNRDGTTVTGQCSVEIKEPYVPIDYIHIMYGDCNIHIGEYTYFTEYIYPTNASNQTVTWSSSDEDVAVVDPVTGSINAVGIGTACITATADGVSGSAYIYVVELRESIDYILNFTDIGDTGSITVVLSQCDESHTVSFESYDESVVTVDSDGIVTAVGAGTTVIYVLVDGAVQDEIPVEVPEANWVTGVSIDTGVTETWVNGKLSLICYLEPSDGEYESIVWSSGDESVARVSPDGEFTAINPGSVDITVTVYVHGSTTVSDTVRFYVLDE